MSRKLFSRLLIPALAAALAAPAAAEDAHHPPADSAKPAATQPATPARPRAGQPQGPGGMMMGNMMMGNMPMMGMMQMMQMMNQMMSGMTPDRDSMHRMRMMGMGGMGMMGRMPGAMAAAAVERVEGHIAFVKAELKITAAQETVWKDYAGALRANAKQLNELAAELAKAPAAASPVERLALREKTLAARLEIARRTKPALTALYATLSDEQKKAFQQLVAPRMRMGMGMH